MLRNKLVLCLLAYMAILLASCKKDQALENPTSIDQKTILIGDQNSRKSRCRTDHKMQEIYQKSPSYRNAIEEGRAISRQNMQSLNARSDAEEPLLTIPVHFIIVHGPNEALGSGSNISKERILSQLEVLNFDFLRKNTDAGPNTCCLPGSW